MTNSKFKVGDRIEYDGNKLRITGVTDKKYIFINEDHKTSGFMNINDIDNGFIHYNDDESINFEFKPAILIPKEAWK